MKPHVLLIEPMMPEVEAQLDAAYCVHPLFAAHDRAALLAAIGSSVRAIDRVGADAVDGDDLQPRQCIDDLIAGAMRAEPIAMQPPWPIIGAHMRGIANQNHAAAMPFVECDPIDKIAVAIGDLHAEPLRLARHGTAYMANAENAQPLAAHLGSQRQVFM
jgi:hypothetical protein